MNQEIQDMLHQIALQLNDMILAVGGDPADPTQVAKFVGGCGIETKLKKIISEDLNNE